MADSHDKGAILSILEELGRGGEIVRNLLGGRFESAGRHVLQGMLNSIDAPILGIDLLPNEVARKEDSYSGKELLGDYGVDVGDGFGGKVANFAAETILDPITYTPGSLVKAGASGAAKLAAKAASKVIGEEAVSAAGRAVRSVSGAQRLSPEARALADVARAAGNNEAQAGYKAVKSSALAKLTLEQDQAVSDILDNLLWRDGKVAGRLGPEGSTALERVGLHPNVAPESREAVAQAVQDLINIGQSQAKRPGIFTPGNLPEEYLGRTWTGQTEEQLINEMLGAGPSRMGAAGSAKELKLKTPEDIASFMEANPKAQFERSAVKRMASRAETQGKLATRAEIGKGLVGPEFTYADEGMRTAANDMIREMALKDPESAKFLHDAFNGLAPRGAFTSWLAKYAGPWKKQAVFGFALPRIGSLVRNEIGGVLQTYANPASRSLTLQQAARAPMNLAGSVVDSLGLKVPKDELSGILNSWESALAKSGGSADTALAEMAKTHPKEAELFRFGISDGFVPSEELVKDLSQSGWKKTLSDIGNWPGKLFGGVESRMRIGLAVDAMRAGMSPQEAAKLASDTFYSYAHTSAANRAVRDILPFSQWVMKSVPQSASMLMEQPILAGGIGRLAGGSEEDPVYRSMRGKINIPLGDDTYVSSLGVPAESLLQIPNPSGNIRDLGRQLESGVGSMLHPLLKGAFSAVAGEDPWSGQEWGSNSKLPGNLEGGEFGRAYNMALSFGTPGLAQVDSILRNIGKWTDDRRSIGSRALDQLSGAQVISVDRDAALAQQLTDALAANPDISQIRTPINTGGDVQAQELINELRAVRARQKAKKMASSL